METVRGIVDHDVIRLVTPLALPAGSEIEFEPRIVHSAQDAPPFDIYKILDQRVSTGIPDLAARHNEHQP